ncbi:transcriptional regulator SdiA [Izhakiella australiensis]|uniref:Transcriptional regulator SdiA n=1 Tax=Izhakiella australiensis TaxID=1926881 RepID=A0A1S8YNR2_9GAMM|nr:transcriptional regulator SdiA [Izhakiella australiensis]OON40801.1 transcriptional regulator SdiA [Izhakiella australiensis]
MTSESYFSWRSEVQTAFQSVSEIVQLTKIIARETRWLAFDNFALFIRQPVPFTRPKTFIYSNHNEHFIRHYLKEEYSHFDPVVQACQLPGKILRWEDAFFSSHHYLHELIKANGIKSGISYSSMAKSRTIGILSMSSANSMKNKTISLEEELKLPLLTELALSALVRMEDASMSVLNMELSDRELEILKWTAEGKTSAEISLILAISENTVNFHQKNMQKRFNAPNKTQIASYAAAIGLI